MAHSTFCRLTTALHNKNDLEAVFVVASSVLFLNPTSVSAVENPTLTKPATATEIKELPQTGAVSSLFEVLALLNTTGGFTK